MKKALKNIIASILPQLVNIVTNLVLPGLIIIKFGSEINGLVSTIKTIITYIGLVGAGIAAAVTQALYEPVSKKDDMKTMGMLHSAGNMFNKYGFLFCLITIIVAFAYPFFLSTEINYWTMVLLLVVMSFSGASEFFAIGRHRALLYADQKVYVCSLIQAASLALSFVLAIIMLRMNSNIIIVEFSITLVYVLRGFFLSLYVSAKYPNLKKYRKIEPNYEATSKRNDAMIHQLSGVLVAGSQSIILSVFVGLEAASIFAVYNIVFAGLQSICSNMSTAVTPFLGKKMALGEKEQLNKLYDLVELFFFILVSFLYSVTAITILPFVSIYTKGADISYYYPTFAYLFVLSSSIYILKLPSISVINISGHFKETRIHAILEAIICVAISISLTLAIGKNGVLIGTAVAMGFRCLATIIYSEKKILGIDSKRSLSRVFSVFLLLVFACFVESKIEYQPSNYLEWIFMASIASIIAIFIIVIALLTFENDTLSYGLSLIKKKNGTETK